MDCLGTSRILFPPMERMRFLKLVVFAISSIFFTSESPRQDKMQGVNVDVAAHAASVRRSRNTNPDRFHWKVIARFSRATT